MTSKKSKKESDRRQFLGVTGGLAAGLGASIFGSGFSILAGAPAGRLLNDDVIIVKEDDDQIPKTFTQPGGTVSNSGSASSSASGSNTQTSSNSGTASGSNSRSITTPNGTLSGSISGSGTASASGTITVSRSSSFSGSGSGSGSETITIITSDSNFTRGIDIASLRGDSTKYLTLGQG